MTSLGILWKKTLRSLGSGWKQFLAIVGIGAVAVTLFVGLLSNAQSLSNRVESVYLAGAEPDIYVTTTSREKNDFEKIRERLEEADLMESRTQLPALLGGRLAYGVVEHLPISQIELAKPINIEIMNEAHEDDYYFLIDKTIVKDDPTVVLNGNAVVSYDLASFLDKGVANKLAPFVKEGGINVLAADELEVTYPITAKMDCSANITRGSYNQATFFMSKKMFAQKVRDIILDNYDEFGSGLIRMFLGFDENWEIDYEDPSSFPGDNQYIISLNNKKTLAAKEEAIRDYFAQKEGGSNLYAVTDRESNPWSIALDTDVKEATQLTFVFPFVFFLVALLVILTTMSEIIVKERSQIGTLKALGVKNHQITLHYVSLTEFLVLLGIIIGFVLGPIIVPAIMDQKYSILYSLPAKAPFVFPWVEALITAAAFLLVAGLVTVFASRKAISLLPADSMRPARIAFKAKPKKESKKSNTFMLSLHMAFRNIRVNLVKSLMVIVGVLGCTALLVCGFGIDDTLNHGVDIEITGYYDADITLTYTNAGPSHKNELEAVSGVTGAEEVFWSAETLERRDDSGEVIRSMASRVYFFDDGYSHFDVKIPEDKVMISQKVADELDLKVGDYIYFNYAGNLLSGEIGKVYDAFITHGVFCYFSDYPEVFFDDGQDLRLYKTAWVDVAKDVDVGVVEKRLEDLSFVGAVESKKDLIARITDILGGISMMTLAVKVFAIILAVVVLYNLGLLNFRERERDIATLRVLGFSPLEIALSLVSETMILTFIGALLGLAVGYPFMYLVLFVNRVSLVEFVYTVFPTTYVIGFLLTFLVAFAVNIYFAFRTSRVKMVESLKSVE